MVYDTVIIGAGPAGLFAAQMIGKKQKKVLILERNKKVGKKLLISGSGQCNYTHAGPIEDFFDKYGDHEKFIRIALKNFNNTDCQSFFKKEGIDSEIQENGKVFPISRKSTDILNVLLMRCQKFGVSILCEQKVEKISFYDDLFIVETACNSRYTAKNVIVSTGGKSYASLGTDGSGYLLAESFNHTIISPRPALTNISLTEKKWSEISGISFEKIEMTIWQEGKKRKQRVGNILFTHKGLSGPLILDATRWIAPGDTLSLNFLYPLTEEMVKQKFAQDIPSRGKEQISTYLKNLDLPKNFIKVLLEVLGIDLELPCAKLTKVQRANLVLGLTKHLFTVDTLGDFRTAMVTAGGIHLKEVNPTTLESRKQKGLYFIGEVLDIDGDTGGYNIQAAFSTAYTCAKHIREK